MVFCGVHKMKNCKSKSSYEFWTKFWLKLNFNGNICIIGYLIFVVRAFRFSETPTVNW